MLFLQDVSKSRSGGLKSFKRPLKVTQAFELPYCRQRCPVRLYELYMSRCPPDRNDDALYLRPLDKYTADRWYCKVPIGINTLGSVVSSLCARAGFVGFFSNHSLRATAATRLFSANVDEQLIKLKTGHSSDAVRNYKRVSDEQLCSLTDIISSKCAKRRKLN
jgi:integrase